MPTATGADSDIALIVRAVLRLARRLRIETGSEDLSGGALGLLAALHRAGPMPAVALAAEEGLAPQSLTRLLRSLEDKAMIERRPDPADRRNKIIVITAHGSQLLRRAMRDRRQWLDDAMTERLGDDERKRLVETAHLLLRLAV